MKREQPRPTAHSRTLSFRITEDIHEGLTQAAQREANPPSAIARRLIVKGLERERMLAAAEAKQQVAKG